MTDDSGSRATPATEPDPPPNESSDARSPFDAVVLHLRSEDARVPAECACCGAPATRRSRMARRFGRAALVVPYCSECHEHVSSVATEDLATILSVAILTLTFLFGVPLVFTPPSALVYGLIVALVGASPLGALYILSRRAPKPGHAAAGRAVFFRNDGSVVVRNRTWGAELARTSSVPMSVERVRESRTPALGAAIPLGALLVAPIVFHFHFPPVRIVNVTGEAVEVFVDDRPLARVESTSGESPEAGVWVRVPAGKRTFRASTLQGRPVDETPFVVDGGTLYFYAPGSDAFCFWVESTGYGAQSGSGTRIEPLAGPPRFWALLDGIDLWFSPTPVAEKGRSSGGILRAVRQARCTEAPEGARGVVSPGPLPAPFATDRE